MLSFEVLYIVQLVTVMSNVAFQSLLKALMSI